MKKKKKELDGQPTEPPRSPIFPCSLTEEGLPAFLSPENSYITFKIVEISLSL